MAGPAESLNVAMAGTVLCFESARQRSRSRPASVGCRRDGYLDDAPTRAARSRGRDTLDGSPRPSAASPGRGSALSELKSSIKSLDARRPSSRRQDVGRRHQAAHHRAGRRAPSRARRRRSGRGGGRATASTSPSAATAARAAPAPGHPGAARARGHLRGHGLPRGAGARGRGRLAQLRGAQHAARRTRRARCRTPSTSSSAMPSR